MGVGRRGNLRAPGQPAPPISVVLAPEDFDVIAAMVMRGFAATRGAAVKHIVHIGLSALRAAAEAERVGDVDPDDAALAVLHGQRADELLIRNALDLISDTLIKIAARTGPGGALALASGCQTAFAEWVEQQEAVWGTREEFAYREAGIAR